MLKIVFLLIGFISLSTSKLYSSSGEPVVKVKAFTEEEQKSLPIELKNRTWTEVRSSLYDGEGGTRLFIVLPQSKQAKTDDVRTTFADYADWLKIAELDGAILVLPDPGNDLIWNESDLAYLEALYAHCNKYVLEGASRYIAAYGDAGNPVSLFAVKHTEKIAAAAFVGADMADINDQNIVKKNLPLSVQIINPTGENSRTLTNYFKTANETDKTNSMNPNEVVYFKSGSSAWNSDYSKSHFIRVINNMSSGFPSFIYNNLFHDVARWKTIAGEGTLRAKVRAGDVDGFEKIIEKSNPNRNAFVYIPSSIRKGTLERAVPMVMLFHGRRCTGDYFIDQTEWYKTAEKNNFIVYAPNGFDYNWNIFNEDSLADDYTYFSNRVNEFTSSGITVGAKTYKIDPSRIYVFGFSNGSFFSSGLIMKYPDKFAAAALWAGGLNPSTVKNKMEKPIPVWYGIGDKDNYYDEWKSDWIEMVNYFIELAGGSPSNKSTIFYSAFGTGNVIKVDVFNCGKIEIRNSEATNIIHGCINEMSNYIWDDFFSKYRKHNGESITVIPND